jgi:uroporphyrinogen decarboxylase
MNGLERVKATFRREEVDRVPFYPILSGLAAELLGVSTSDYYRDLGNMADAQLRLYDEIEQDVVVLMADLFMEVHAMGAEVEFPVDDVPRLKSYLLRNKAALGSLSQPDPEKSGRLPSYLQACRKVAGVVKESATGGVICGPWTLATNLRGAQDLIIDTVEDPGFVHELMRFTATITSCFGEAVSRCGVGLSLSEAPASISLISPKIFREFVAPYLKEVIADLRGKKAAVTLHICGLIDPIMEDIVSTGAVAVSMDEPSSLEKMLDVCGSKCVVIGNVSTGVFIDGPREDIENEIKRCLDIGREKGGYILCTGCEISPKGDMDRVKLFCDLASSMGRVR